MELVKNLKYMCRVCTRTKKSNSAIPATNGGTYYCVFETPFLKDKLERYLSMEIDENDGLPNSICPNCFKRVLSIDQFAETAKTTENFLKKFIHISRGGINTQSADPAAINQYIQNEYNTLTNYVNQRNLSDEMGSESDDVVLNVSLNDPLTRDIHTKISKAKQRKSAQQQTSTGRQDFRSSTTIDTIRYDTAQRKRYTPSERSVLLKNVQMPPLKPISMTTVHALPTAQQISVRNFAKETPSTSRGFPDFASVKDCLILGSVIKDTDLLLLILKALKWPYGENTLPMQLQRLKNTPFRDVMVDPNLLQDADLQQILSSYLGPVMGQAPPPLTPVQLTPPSFPPTPKITPSFAYKLPAETSIQVVNVQPDEGVDLNACTTPIKRRRPVKIARRKKETPVIVLSDESDAGEGDVQLEVSVDPMLFFAGGDSSNSNESLLAGLNLQRKRLMEQKNTPPKQKQRRKQTLSKLRRVPEEEDDDVMFVSREIISKKRAREQSLGFRSQPSTSAAAIRRDSKPKTYPVAQKKQRAIEEVEKVTPAGVLSKSDVVKLLSHENTCDEIDTTASVPDPAITNIEAWKDFCVDSPEPSESPKSGGNENPPSKTFADADSTTKSTNRESIGEMPERTDCLDLEECPRESTTDNDSKNDKQEEKVESGNEQSWRDKPSPSCVESSAADTSEVVSEKKPVEEQSSKNENQSQELAITDTETEEARAKSVEKFVGVKIKVEHKDDDEFEVSGSLTDDQDKTPNISSSRSRTQAVPRPIKVESIIATRLMKRRQIEQKKETVKQKVVPTVETNVAVRPARRSKTFSKYYKGPPAPTSSPSSTTSRGSRPGTRKRS